MSTTRKKIPAIEQTAKELPSTDMQDKEVPNVAMPIKVTPEIGVPENTVMIGGRPIEIKPTKLKYQRNRTALFYKMLDVYPLADIMGMETGTLGDDRDGDKAVMNFLIAATDDEQQIVEHYDEMDTETIETILSIFKRLNKIDEKEAKLKKMEAERKKVV